MDKIKTLAVGEQQALARMLSNVERLIELTEKKKQTLIALYKSINHGAQTGLIDLTRISQPQETGEDTHESQT